MKIIEEQRIKIINEKAGKVLESLLEVLENKMLSKDEEIFAEDIIQEIVDEWRWDNN